MRIAALFLILSLVNCGSSDGAPVAADAGALLDVAADKDGVVAARNVGDSCEAASECPKGGSGKVVCLTTGYPEGYCAVSDCADHGHDCPSDPGLGGTPGPTSSKCVKSGAGNACLRLCAKKDDCRAGYSCVNRDDAAGHGQASVCLPTDATTDAGMSSEGGMGEGGMGEGGMGEGGMGEGGMGEGGMGM